MVHTSTLDISKYPEWSTPKVKSTAGRQHIYSWLFAIAWNGFIGASIYFAHEEILKGFNAQPIFWSFVLFPIAGLFVVLMATKQTLAWRRYGQTPLTMNPHPGQIGGVVGGHVDFDIEYADSLEVIVSLSCVKHYWTKRNNEKDKTFKTLWHDSKPLQTFPSASGSRIEFAFSPDKTLPETKKQTDEQIEWVLEVEIKSISPALKRQFKIPVALTSDADIAQAERYTKPGRTRTKQDLSEKTKNPQISRIGDNVRFLFPASKNRTFGLGLVAVAIFTGFFATFILSEFIDVIPTVTLMMFIVTGLVIFLLIAVGLFIATNSVTTIISPEGIKVSNKFMGMTFHEHVSADEITALEATKTGSSGDGESFRASYSIRLLHMNGKYTVLGGNLMGETHAEQVRQKMLDALGTNWRAATVLSEPQQHPLYLQHLPKPVSKIASFLRSFRVAGALAFPLAMLYDGRHFLDKMLTELERIL